MPNACATLGGYEAFYYREHVAIRISAENRAAGRSREVGFMRHTHDGAAAAVDNIISVSETSQMAGWGTSHQGILAAIPSEERKCS